MSLSSWLRDYLYISLGGNRHGAARTVRNVLVTMLLGGLWHGAAWNFVLWGAWHGAGLLAVRWWQAGVGARRPLPAWLARLATFLFVLYGWLLFRAGSWAHVRGLTCALAHWSAPPWLPHYLLSLVVFVLPLLLVQLWQWKARNLLAPAGAAAWVRCGLQGLVLLGLLLFWEQQPVAFIYFQF
jgi:hypothetical protein